MLRYARQRVPQPGRILDVGCGTGRLAARLEAAFAGTLVVGVDLSTGMVRHAAARADTGAVFVAGCAERLPFAGAVFGLVVVTLSMAHWWDVAAGLGEIRRVMAPGAVLVAAETMPVSRPWLGAALARWRRVGPPGGLPSLIAASGLRVRRVEPIRPIAVAADAVLITADLPH